MDRGLARAPNANFVAVPHARLRGDINNVQVESADQGLSGTRTKEDGARPHPVDVAVAWLSRRSGLFARGWGDEAALAEFSSRARYLLAPAPVAVKWNANCKHGDDLCREGTFPSPLPVLPDAVRTVHVRALT